MNKLEGNPTGGGKKMHNSKTQWLAAILIVATAAAVTLWATNGLNAADDVGPIAAPTEKLTITQIMKITHKKPQQLLKKVALGAANAAQKQELLKLYQDLSTLKPPKGDMSSWQAKTKLLVDAADDAVKGKPGAGQQLQRAANCMACHRAHK